MWAGSKTLGAGLGVPEVASYMSVLEGSTHYISFLDVHNFIFLKKYICIPVLQRLHYILRLSNKSRRVNASKILRDTQIPPNYVKARDLLVA